MLQPELVSLVLVTLILSVCILVAGRKMKRLTIHEKPKGFALNAVLYVQTITNFATQNMGQKHGRRMAAYIGSVFLYLLVSNMFGLTGFPAPTSNYSVTLVLAIITFVLIQSAKVEANGFKGYLKGFFEPFFPFVIPNVFGTIAPLISLSLRLFGNVLSGTVIMTLLYSFTAWLSAMVPGVGSFNFFGVIVAPVLHLYFDMFSAFLQAFIFISLTSILIAVEYQD